MPFRAMQPVIDILLRNAPHKVRAPREREQADEIYKAGHSIRVNWANIIYPYKTEIFPAFFLDTFTKRSVTTSRCEQEYGICASMPALLAKQPLRMEMPSTYCRSQ